MAETELIGAATPLTPPAVPHGASRDGAVFAVHGGAGSTAQVAPDRARQAAAAARRGIDVLAAILLLLCLLPLLLIVAVLIKLDTRGPVLFRQRRLGRDMRPFTVLKFRTMVNDATPDRHSRYIAQLAEGSVHGGRSDLKKLTNDPRVTRMGRALRRLSIDEVPQLLNVIAGHMALIGPRPALEYELQYYEPRHFERFRVRPGITGLWQVSGRNALGFKEMLELDAEYAATATLGTDMRILARTPRAAVRNAA